MDKNQNELVKSYFRKRSINTGEGYTYYEISYMIKVNPEFINTLSSHTIVTVLSAKPDLIQYVDLSKIDPSSIKDFLQLFPEYMDKIDFKMFNSSYDIDGMLSNFPQSMSKFSDEQLDLLDDEDIYALLLKRPGFISFLNYKKLDKKHLLRLLRKYPEMTKTIGDEYLSQFESKIGIKDALENDDGDALLDLIANSNIMNELTNSPEPTIDKRAANIDLNISKEDMIKMLDLGDDYSGIASNAGYSYNDYYSEDEADYMGNSIDDDNQELIKKIAKMIGVQNEIETEDFWREEGQLKDFLEKYGFGKVVTAYVEGYSDERQRAEQAECQELVDAVPFDVDDASFNIEEMYEYYQKNNLTAENFDELIDDIKGKLPYFSWESVSGYESMDYGEFNRNVYNALQDVISDIELDENNEYYERAQMMSAATEHLDKLGMKPYKGALGVIDKDKTKIIIKDIESEEQDDGSFKIMVTAIVWYIPTAEDYFNTNTGDEIVSKKIKVPITSLRNYILQPQLPLKEGMSLMRLFESIDKNQLDAWTEYLYDDLPDPADDIAQVEEDLDNENVDDASPEMNMYKIGKEISEEHQNENGVKVKDIISNLPSDINDIFEICKNEISLSNNDLLITQLYTKIYYDCLITYHNLTFKNVDIINDVRNSIMKSNNINEVKLQYKRITKPNHILPASLLKMINNYKKIKFSNDYLENWKPFDVIMNLLKSKFTGISSYSDTFLKKLLSSTIIIEKH